MIHEPCIDLKFGFRKRKWCSCVLEEKLCFDPKACIKIHVFVFVFMKSPSMDTKVHVFELISWNLIFWIKSMIFGIHVLQKETQISKLHILKWGHRDHSRPDLLPRPSIVSHLGLPCMITCTLVYLACTPRSTTAHLGRPWYTLAGTL